VANIGVSHPPKKQRLAEDLDEDVFLASDETDVEECPVLLPAQENSNVAVVGEPLQDLEVRASQESKGGVVEGKVLQDPKAPGALVPRAKLRKPMIVVESDEEEVAVELRAEDGRDEIIGANLKNSPDVNYSDILGYSHHQFEPPACMVSPKRGCVNKDKTQCYAISVLRALSSFPGVHEWATQHATSHRASDARNGGRRLKKDSVCVLCILCDDLQDLSREGLPLTPRLTIHRSKWSRWVRPRQECAMEALQLLLQHCHAIDVAAVRTLEIVGNEAAHLTYPYVSMFGGLWETTLQCGFARCARVSTRVESFMSLSVNIPTGKKVTLKVAVMDSQNWEFLGNSPCPECKKSLRQKKNKIVQFPKILVLHVKRWRIGPCRKRWVKDQRPISFDQFMPLDDRTYALRAIVCHSGLVCEGHYVAYVCSLSQRWFKCDDENVTEVSWEHVKFVQAYVLFYEHEICTPQAALT
jgi:uncharacterized UBP type Zn finger protein